MKRILFWCILLLVGCTQAPVEEVSMTTPEEFYAVIEGADEQSDSRTFLDEKIRLRWTVDDRITIFRKTTYNREYRFTGLTGQNAGGFAQVSVDDEFWYGATLPYNYAAYPHSEFMTFHEDGYFELIMPWKQEYTPNSVGLGANTMVAMSEGGQLMFKNVGSFLRVRLWGENQLVSSITLITKGDEILAGPAKVTPSLTEGPHCEMIGAIPNITLTCATPVEISDSEDSPTDFWIVLPPITLANGFTVRVENPNGNSQSFEVDHSFTFEQNTYYNLKRELTTEFVPTNTISYKATEKVTPTYTNGFGAIYLPEESTYDSETQSGVLVFDRPITSVGSYAFWECTSLTAVYLPNSVKAIGKDAFSFCESLGYIHIPNSLTSIGDFAFYCADITSIKIPSGVTEVGPGAFANCVLLQEFKSDFVSFDGRCLILDGVLKAFAPSGVGRTYYIPREVTSIEAYAFNLGSCLKGITISENVTSIGEYAFLDCMDLDILTISDSVKSIGEGAFSGCSSLTSVTIPESVMSIGSHAFYNCSSLKEFKGKFASSDKRCLIVNGVLNSFAPADLTSYTILDGVTSIGQSAFSGCASLSSISFPIGVTSIGNSSFSGCRSLNSISLPLSLKTIDTGAFYNCTSLTSVLIPEGVTSIGTSAFLNCTSLESVYCKAINPPAVDIDSFDENAPGRKIYVPESDDNSIINAYKSKYAWPIYASSLVESDFSDVE